MTPATAHRPLTTEPPVPDRPPSKSEVTPPIVHWPLTTGHWTLIDPRVRLK